MAIAPRDAKRKGGSPVVSVSGRRDAAWAKEAESRIDAHGEGRMTSVSAQAVFRRIGMR